MNELISVVVAIYNIENYLEPCLSSLVNQTYQNLEIILVNDGSKDNSLLICQKYASKDKRIKIVNKENGGLSDARNKGIENANGEYICFVDGDDYLDIHYVEKMHELITHNKSDMVIVNFDFVYPDRVEPFVDNTKEGVMKASEAMDNLFKDGNWAFTVAWNKLFKRSIFKDIKFTKGIIYEDADIIYKIYDKIESVYFSKDILYHYVQRDNSTLHNLNVKKQYDFLIVYKNRFYYLKKLNYRQEILKKAYYYYISELVAISAQFKNEKYHEECKQCLKEYKEQRKHSKDYDLLSFKQKFVLFIKTILIKTNTLNIARKIARKK